MNLLLLINQPLQLTYIYLGIGLPHSLLAYIGFKSLIKNRELMTLVEQLAWIIIITVIPIIGPSFYYLSEKSRNKRI